MSVDSNRTLTESGSPSDELSSAAISSVLQNIGPYRITSRLGEGGMGVVYQAEQHHPIRRSVAIKVVRAELGSSNVIARFEAERQALARMDHPHVAKVLDAGTDNYGRPYFVMDLVPGVPITRFCDENRLSIADRLKLFLQVCDAISHAHTKAILHRDIKSTNVLAYYADGIPSVKVIDFGIAKALTDDRLSDRLATTQEGQPIGTYESMSPEQADGSPDLDTRTDVYALGVLLYELLCGQKPFADYMKPGVSENDIREVIREKNPPRPSDRISLKADDSRVPEIADARRTAPGELTRRLRTELEWIPMMAVRKERERRYASPLQMAEDIQNYLNDRPLRAAPESKLYILRKALWRNRNAVLTGVAFVTAICVGVALYLHKVHADERRILAEQQKTEHQLSKATAFQAFLQCVLGAGTDADKVFWNQIDQTISDQPSTYGMTASQIAQHYGQIGKYSVEEPFRRLAFETDFAANPNTPQAVSSFEGLFVNLIYRNEFKDARNYLDKVGGLPWAERIMGKTHPSVVRLTRYTAQLLEKEGRLQEAESLYLGKIDELQRDPAADIHEKLFIRDFLAHFYANNGQLPKSIQMYRTLVNEARAVPAEKNDMLNMWLSLLAQALLKEGTPEDLKEAEPLFQEAVQRGDELMKPNDIERINILGPYARLLDREHRWNEAAPYWEHVLTIARAAEVAEKQRWLAFARYAYSLRLQGQNAKADAVLDQELKDLTQGGADAALLSQVRNLWVQEWDYDAKADAERAGRK